MTAAAPISCLLVKIASRCNLACDYCYMYEHADQSWRQQPRLMSMSVRESLASRIAEYVDAANQDRLSVVFHGGEPLLAGIDGLANFARQLRSHTPRTTLDLGLQTNGLLLTDEALAILAAEDIAVSLSLDGPPEVHDQHRIGKQGEASFERVNAALSRLKRYPEIFTGVIAVVDPTSDPAALIKWFAGQHLPALDLLLPDANHDNPPTGKTENETVYVDWMISAFDTWYDEYPDLRLRTFDALVAAICGVPSGTDAFGFGDVSLLSIETDGSYHDLDVLKTTFEGRTALGMHVDTTSIVEAARAEPIIEHRRLLTLNGLASECKACPEVSVCAGGAVAHRYQTGTDGGGFANASIYCLEMLTLIKHVRARVENTLAEESASRSRAAQSDVMDWEQIDTAVPGLNSLDAALVEWRTDALHRLEEALSATWTVLPAPHDIARFRLLSPWRRELAATTASAQLWLRVFEADRRGLPLLALDGTPLIADGAALKRILSRATTESDEIRPSVHRNEVLLRLPFGAPIEFLDQNVELSTHVAGVQRSLHAVELYSPAVRDEMSVLCSDVQLIRDTSAHVDKSVSFSDDSVPGCLFVSVPTEWSELAAFDMADSLIHEYRHQKLYLVGRRAVLIGDDTTFVVSPWREEPRPPSGVLHALFVFVELLSFWRWVSDKADINVETRSAAQSKSFQILEQLRQGFEVIQTCPLTPAGFGLISQLRERAGVR